jgi:hypothetical protein
MEKLLKRRERIAEELDDTIDTLAELYQEFKAVNSEIPGNRNFDTVKLDQRLTARLASALKAGKNSRNQTRVGATTRLADHVRKDHEELAAKGGRVITIGNERQKVIEKVVKLLALAESTNLDAERASAKARATELMEKYGIAIGDVKKGA